MTLSAPLIWIVLPGAAALGLFFMRGRARLSAWMGVGLAFGLCLLAWRLPVGETTRLGPLGFEIGDTLFILGRRFILADIDRPLLTVVFLLAAFWLGGCATARPGPMAVSLGLGVVALLTAALAVEPFLFAALLIELAALFCVPILSPPGVRPGRGVLRFLTFQTLGMPFILFTGWMLAGLDVNPGDQVLLTRAGMMLGFGFGFLLAIFPFHTWVPMLAEEAHPYAVAFVFLVLPQLVMTFGLGFLDRYAWLRALPQALMVIRLAGVVMAAAGGFWAAFQRHLGRMMGYAVMVEIGLALIAISLPGGLALHFALLLPRALGVGVWALALTVIAYPRRAQAGWPELQHGEADSRSPRDNLSFSAVRGAARRLPLACAGVMVAHLGLAGMPLLAGFPARLVLLEQLAGESLGLTLATMFGSAGLFFGGIRTLAVLLSPAGTGGHLPGRPPPDHPAGAESLPSVRSAPTQRGESWPETILLGVGMLALFTAGIFPHWFLPLVSGLAQGFEALGG